MGKTACKTKRQRPLGPPVRSANEAANSKHMLRDLNKQKEIDQALAAAPGQHKLSVKCKSIRGVRDNATSLLLGRAPSLTHNGLQCVQLTPCYMLPFSIAASEG